MSGLPSEYVRLMKNALKEESEPSRPLKRRKKRDANSNTPETEEVVQQRSRTPSKTSSKTPPPVIETIDLTSEDESHRPSPKTPSKTAIQMDINQQTPEAPTISSNTKEVDDKDSEFDDDDEDIDFEDVDLENAPTKASRMLNDDVVITVDKVEPETKKSKRTRNTISKEERQYRKDFHRSCVASMMLHGLIRNNWCNDPSIHKSLKKLISAKIYDELHPSSRIKVPQMRTRTFLDGLRHLMEKWISYYNVTSNKGIYKHDWYDWVGIERSPTSFERFTRCMERGRGTRDIGAQGFVALLRAADVPSRLVFSLQPPDFTNRQIKERKSDTTEHSASQLTPQEKLLALRKGKTASPAKSRVTQAEVEMKYPVFWAEAWDSTSKTWITIDPIMFRTIENVKYKSKLEPPLSHPYNTLTYVIGYDKMNGVRDITKRYAEKYYSKTRKKRITKEESDEIWYSGFIDALNSRPRNKADQFEDEYFAKRAEQEGMPDNVQDFKGHPFYCLESQLKSNEIVHPFEPCGLLRVKGRNETIQVHKRSNVQYLRSPRAWYQRGRVLKTGAKPMKVRQKTSLQMSRNLAFDDDDEDKEERLYAEFQTELYVPPPATDGLIEKNAYGNIDVFVPSMIPEGAVLIDSGYAEDAAKALGIDYAPAVIGFKFDRRQATPKIGGVVVGADFKEAMEVVQEQLRVEGIEKERIALEIRALKGWNLLLTKLRIKQRLDKSHGKLDEDVELNSEDEFKKMQKEYEEYAANDDEGDELSFGENDSEDDDGKPKERIMDGGFLAEDAVWDQPPGFQNESDSGGFVAEGGFLPDEEQSDDGVSGGFLPDDEPRGFISDDEEVQDEDNAGGFLPDSEEEEEEGEDNQDDAGDFEDYEAFMDGLGDDYNEEEDEDEEGVEVQGEGHAVEQEQITRGPEEQPVTAVTEEDGIDSDELPEQDEKITETIPSSSEVPESPLTDTNAGAVVEILSDDVTPPRSVISKAEAGPEPEPEPTDVSVVEAEVKQLSQDEELERQVKEQLERERERTPDEVIEIADEDDEFEYYSD